MEPVDKETQDLRSKIDQMLEMATNSYDFKQGEQKSKQADFTKLFDSSFLNTRKEATDDLE